VTLEPRGAPAGSSGSSPGAGVLYAVWGAIGLSVLVEFALLLVLQRGGSVEISDRGGALAPGVHVALALALFAGLALVVGLLRSKSRDPERLARASSETPAPARADAGGPGVPARVVQLRFLALNAIGWVAAESLAILGFGLALGLPPVPRLALTVYFTGALFLWLWSRPDLSALSEAQRRAAGRA
jgi:hypothetical protein